MSAHLSVPCSCCRQQGAWVVHRCDAEGVVIRRCECGAWEQFDSATGRWNEFDGPSLRDPIGEPQ